LRLASSAEYRSARPTAHQIKAKPVPCEFELAAGDTLTICNPQGFAAIRELTCVDHGAYFASLTQDELLGGSTQASGKSGSIFWFSKDGRFVLKTVPEEELETLLAMLPKYARHLRDHRDSLLTRYLGAYRLTQRAGSEVVRVVVMNNILEGARHHKVYDLKGTTEDRWVEEAEGTCLKDINFESMAVHMGAALSERLHAVLHADTQFLERMQLMDYSLILSVQFLSEDAHVSVHPKRFSQLMGGLEGTVCREVAGRRVDDACVFHIGLADMLTTYGFKKKVAHAVKSSTIGHFYDIDTEPPDVYAERFRSYLHRKLLAKAEGVSAGAAPKLGTAAANSGRPQGTATPQPRGGGEPAAAVDLLMLDAGPDSKPCCPVADLLDFDPKCGAPATARPAGRSALPAAAVGLDLLA